MLKPIFILFLFQQTIEEVCFLTKEAAKNALLFPAEIVSQLQLWNLQVAFQFKQQQLTNTTI